MFKWLCAFIFVLVIPYTTERLVASPQSGGATTQTTQGNSQGNPQQPALIAVLSADPGKIVIQGIRGNSQDNIGISLRSSAPANLRWSVTQLATADGTHRLPTDVVTVNCDEQKIAVEANFPIDVPICFDLDNAHSGEYNANLYFFPTAGGNPLSVPVTVRLKDPIWIALIVLAVSLGISVALSIYRTSGRRRDLLILQVAPIQKILNDPELQAFAEFHDSLNASLSNLARQLTNPSPDFAVAQTTLNEAEAIARRWQAYRTRWIEAYEQLAQLLKQPNRVNFQDELKAALAAQKAAPQANSPDEFEKAVNALKGKLNAAGGAPALAAATPTKDPFSLEQIARAQRRHSAFEFLLYVAALALLFFVGVKELYSANTTFGANWFIDYSSLVVYGFGAEATRASVISTIRTWGIPGFT